jgi:hypothetical protein
VEQTGLELTLVFTVALFLVDSFSVKKIILPLSLVPVPLLVRHYPPSPLKPIFPSPIVSPKFCLLDSLPTTLAIEKFTVIHGMSQEGSLSILSLLFLSHDDLDSSTRFIIFFELANIVDILAVPQLAVAVILSIFKLSLVDILDGILFFEDEPALAVVEMRLQFSDFSFIEYLL